MQWLNLLKKLALGLFGLLVALAAFLWANKSYRDAHHFDNYEPGAPLNIFVQEPTVVKGADHGQYSLTKFTFDGYKGEKVPTLLSMPTGTGERKFPVIIFLHGIGQNKNFLKEITAPYNQAGFAVACFDQYTQGERKLTGDKSILTRARALSERSSKTVNETRRLIDHLSSRPDIDPKRIYLVGASYGAIVGTIAMAHDKRLRAGVLVYGGGDFRELLNSRANQLGVAAALGYIDAKKFNPEKPPLPTITTGQERTVHLILKCIIPIARYSLGVSDPVYYAGQISPAPVYFQNGKNDVLIPSKAGKALQDAAGQPKKITWYDSDHVGIDLQQTKQVLEDGLKWLLEQDNPLRVPEQRVTNIPPFEISRT